MLIWAVTSIFVVPTTNVRKLILFDLVPRALKRNGSPVSLVRRLRRDRAADGETSSRSMTDKPNWQAAGFHSPNKRWRQSCRIKARSWSKLSWRDCRSYSARVRRRQKVSNGYDAKRLFCSKYAHVFNGLQGQHFSGPTMSMKQGAILKAGAARTSEANRVNHCTVATFRYVRGVVSRVALKELQT
jgi:hypothetical protein